MATARVSRGCLPCRTRRVKCDEARPSCKRCVNRDGVCHGYRDDATLLFRSENEKVARRVMHRRSSDQSLRRPSPSSQASGIPSPASAAHRKPSNASNQTPAALRNAPSASCKASHLSPTPLGLVVNDPSDLSAELISSLKISTSYPWAKAAPKAPAPSVEDAAVDQFFEKYVMYPCNHRSTPGFLEHLPSLVAGEFKLEGRMALRWAVRATAYASISKEQDSVALGDKALECYGHALSALGEALKDSAHAPDDMTLMTIVVLDIFESVYMPESAITGSHTVGMAQILRLRGPDQIYGTRGWGLFRLSHHRIQKQQMVSKLAILPESERWLDSLNDEMPEVHIEKDNHQISKACQRARSLLQQISTSVSRSQILDMVREMHTLDLKATSWRAGPNWAYKTVHRSELPLDEETMSKFPEFVQLHPDVWIAYEWDYQRTGRILLHENLLRCLDRLETLPPEPHEVQVDISSLRGTSIDIVQFLIDEILSTSPQMLGDIDHEGNLMDDAIGASICKGVGGYFLLWPIRIAKSTKYATAEQAVATQALFERIRECTGMKSALGDASRVGR